MSPRRSAGERVFDYSRAPTFSAVYSINSFFTFAFFRGNISKKPPVCHSLGQTFTTLLFERKKKVGYLAWEFSLDGFLGFRQRMVFSNHSIDLKREFGLLPRMHVIRDGNVLLILESRVYSRGNGYPIYLFDSSRREVGRVIIPFDYRYKKPIKIWLNKKISLSPVEWLGILEAWLIPVLWQN